MKKLEKVPRLDFFSLFRRQDWETVSSATEFERVNISRIADYLTQVRSSHFNQVFRCLCRSVFNLIDGFASVWIPNHSPSANRVSEGFFSTWSVICLFAFQCFILLSQRKGISPRPLIDDLSLCNEKWKSEDEWERIDDKEYSTFLGSRDQSLFVILNSLLKAIQIHPSLLPLFFSSVFISFILR